MALIPPLVTLALVPDGALPPFHIKVETLQTMTTKQYTSFPSYDTLRTPSEVWMFNHVLHKTNTIDHLFMSIQYMWFMNIILIHVYVS